MTMEKKHEMENKIVGRKEEDFPRLMENKTSRFKHCIGHSQKSSLYIPKKNEKAWHDLIE